MHRITWLKGFILIQCLLLAVLTIIFWFLQGFNSGVSALVGGVIGVLPNLVLMSLFFRHTGAQNSQKVIRSFYLGEILKWLLTIGLFTIAFQWSKLRALPMLLVFIAMHMVFWAIPLIAKLTRNSDSGTGS